MKCPASKKNLAIRGATGSPDGSVLAGITQPQNRPNIAIPHRRRQRRAGFVRTRPARARCAVSSPSRLRRTCSRCSEAQRGARARRRGPSAPPPARGARAGTPARRSGVALRRFSTPHSLCARTSFISWNTLAMKPLCAASAIASCSVASQCSNSSSVVAASRAGRSTRPCGRSRPRWRCRSPSRSMRRLQHQARAHQLGRADRQLRGAARRQFGQRLVRPAR